ncbi:HigA family addiction module antitoxin [Capnocytophaga canis]|uniref:HigA family addiction module antitoxin n=1 Tax=Capnocytophaga canis TaxID=1848903 RepID=UPI0015623E1D|nr:HigA family addiction module antitoxin [Capnocytophaga canis]
MATINIKKLVPKQATYPGEHLLDEIQAREMSQKDLAMEMDLPKSVVNEIIKGKKNINTDIALRLEKVLGIPAKFWLNAQADYEIDKRRVEEKHQEFVKNNEIWSVIKSYIRMPFFKREGVITDDLKQNINIIFKVFAVSDLDGFVGRFAELEYQRFRKSEKSNIERNSLVCWVNYVKYKASQLYVSDFNQSEKEQVFKAISEVLYKNKENILDEVKEVLSSYGIKFLIVPKPKDCAVDGVSFWSENPTICLSLRNKSIDSFAFTLFHELSHIYLHLVNNNRKEYINLEEKHQKEEQEADELASKLLIPDDVWKKIKSINFHNESSVMSVSKHYGIHPAILQGRYSKENNNYKIKKIDKDIRQVSFTEKNQ